MTNVSIITIGDELLIGQVVDTNSAWMAQELNKIGFPVINRIAVGDNKDQIVSALEIAAKNADIILITGGLGPTADDITKPLLCEYFGGKLVQDAVALQNVTYLFEQVFKRPLTERNIKQAEVPDVCTVLQNSAGTAPGMLFERNGKIFISMPGVPFEMKEMMRKDVLPLLEKKFSNQQIVHKTLFTSGIGESNLADFVQDLEEQLPQNIRLAYLPNFSMVRMRLTGTAPFQTNLEAEVAKHFELLKQRTAPYLVADKDLSLTEVLGEICMAQKAMLCTAESCTGGFIAHQITSLSGSSNWFNGSVVSYSNDVKKSVLNVSEHTLKTFGAVSEETVIEMLRGVLALTNSTHAMAVSGIMGPGGGTRDKPVGTVWIAVGNLEKCRAKVFKLRYDRQKNIEVTSFLAQNMLREFMLDKNEHAYNLHG